MGKCVVLFQGLIVRAASISFGNDVSLCQI